MRIKERRHVDEDPAIEERFRVKPRPAIPVHFAALHGTQQRVLFAVGEDRKTSTVISRLRLAIDRGKPLSPGIAHIGHAGLAEAVSVIGEQLGVEQSDERHRVLFVRLRQDATAQSVCDEPLLGAEEARRIRRRQTLLDDFPRLRVP
jgi:hypothetical protein